MSKMSELDLKVKTFIQIGHEIEALENKRKELREELVGAIKAGDTVMYKGVVYEWEKYERTSTSWKGLYTDAYAMADDEAQVILGEREARATKKSGPFYRFKTKK